MTYVDLGHYPFVTALDNTGLNPGNLTSTFATSAPINLAKFECYRLLINTSLIPSATPTLVQSVSGIGQSLTTLTLTFPKSTTVGNTIVVAASSNATTTSPTVSAVTIAASADHFGAIPGAASSGNSNVAIWVNPTSAVAGTPIVITLTGGSGSAIVEAYALEISGLNNTTVPASSVEYSSGAFSGSNITTLTTTAGTSSKVNDFLVGLVTQYNNVNNAQLSTGTTAPTMTNLTQLNFAPGGSNFQASLLSWGLTGPVGTNVAYKGISTIAGPMNVGAIALLPPASSAAGAFPFTVAIDGHVWDQQSTIAGVGYTYDLHQPLTLNNGNVLQILWNLPASSYLTSAGLFNITGWFRYDPSLN